MRGDILGVYQLPIAGLVCKEGVEEAVVGLRRCCTIVFKVGGKALVEPQLPPVVAGHQIPKPLQSQRWHCCITFQQPLKPPPNILITRSPNHSSHNSCTVASPSNNPSGHPRSNPLGHSPTPKSPNPRTTAVNSGCTVASPSNNIFLGCHVHCAFRCVGEALFRPRAVESSGQVHTRAGAISMMSKGPRGSCCLAEVKARACEQVAAKA